ncbi:uncharacterized protein PgNI_03865 [Pyricularia grisea]|uniref:Uncharacterized protein n=1 Tax=Pyricularia grisea TaxID=148305 RepID=A0A6P8BED8_PYRGI|nr:uncharacterized protein PgNI_03865 [Pyricularia grisea]TLD14165.1 hypothetical protein PgNI_03865 [Pyricularia grisea]
MGLCSTQQLLVKLALRPTRLHFVSFKRNPFPEEIMLLAKDNQSPCRFSCSPTSFMEQEVELALYQLRREA